MRRRRRPTVVNMLQVGIAAILIGVLILFIIWYSEGLNKYEPGGATFRYVAGVRVDYSENAVYRSKDDVVTVTDASVEETLGEVPILHESRKRLTVPVNMLIVNPPQGLALERVNYFTDIAEEEGAIRLYKDGKSKLVLGGFLYDGEDVYVFLEKTTLNISSRAIQLAPLSYVRVVYEDSLEYYNSADGKFQWIGTSGIDVTAEAASGYTIDLGRDILDTGDMEILLYSAVDNLPVVSMER